MLGTGAADGGAPVADPDRMPRPGGALGDRDWALVVGWNPDSTLTDVLADYDTCDLFARYLVENGAGRGTYHAAIFGYCYLNGVRYLDAGTQQSRLVVEAMFQAACRHLAPGFEQFAADMQAAARAAAARQPVVLALDCGALSWRDEVPHVARVYGLLAELGFAGRLDDDFARAAQSGGAELVLRETALGLLRLVAEPPGFRLTASLDATAVAAANAAALDRLRSDRDTCCYLQLDDLVLLHGPDPRHDALLAVLRLCVHRRYGHAHPGIVEHIGRPGRDYFVVHCPAGPDPDAVRALLLAHHPTHRVVIRPF